jgi:hypothetical protein
LVFLVVSFLLAFPPVSYMHSSPSPFVPCPSQSPWLYVSYEAPHYADFTNLPSPHLPSDQIFPSALFSETPSAYVTPLMSQTKFRTHRQKYNFVYSNLYVFRQQPRRQKVLQWMIASITRAAP